MSWSWAARLLFLLAVGVVALTRVAPVQEEITTSFAGYWAVAREVRAGTPVRRLYDDDALAASMAAHGMTVPEKMIGPPSLALTLVPLAELPYVQARRIWLWGLCLPALVAGLWGLARIGPPVAGPLLAAAFLLGAPAAEGLRVGQVYPMFLLLHVAALRAALTGREGLAGAALAPMIASRGWYGAPLLLGLALAGRVRAALWGAVLSAALLLASVPAVGLDAWVYFFQVHLPEMAHNPWAGATGLQTLRSLTLHLTTADPRWGPDPPIPAPWLAAPLNGVCALTLVLLAIRATRRAGADPGALPRVFGLWTCLELLLGPQAEGYHFVLAALPAIAAWGTRSRSARALVLLALPLLLLELDYQAPALSSGWRTLLAYPRVWGALLLFAACLAPPAGSRAREGTGS